MIPYYNTKGIQWAEKSLYTCPINCSVISAISINVIGSKNDGVHTNEGSEISIAGGTVNSFTRYVL